MRNYWVLGRNPLTNGPPNSILSADSGHFRELKGHADDSEWVWHAILRPEERPALSGGLPVLRAGNDADFLRHASLFCLSIHSHHPNAAQACDRAMRALHEASRPANRG